MKNGSLSRHSNPGPLGHESSALPLDPEFTLGLQKTLNELQSDYFLKFVIKFVVHNTLYLNLKRN
jgi:hypothetical protein